MRQNLASIPEAHKKNRIGIKTRPQMLNESHNAETSGAIFTDASRATVRVIRTGEELMIVR